MVWILSVEFVKNIWYKIKTNMEWYYFHFHSIQFNSQDWSMIQVQSSEQVQLKNCEICELQSMPVIIQFSPSLMLIWSSKVRYVFWILKHSPYDRTFVQYLKIEIYFWAGACKTFQDFFNVFYGLWWNWLHVMKTYSMFMVSLTFKYTCLMNVILSKCYLFINMTNQV